MKKLALMLLYCSGPLAIAQQSAPLSSSARLSNEEALTLKVGLLEQELAEANAKIAGLKQQILLYSTYQNHGWKAGEVNIKLNQEGLPEAVAAPVAQQSVAGTKPND